MPNQYINSSPGVPNGTVEYQSVQTLMKQAGSTFFRIGGNGYDEFGTAIGMGPSNNDYIKAMESVLSINSNAKFLIQIPFESGITASQSFTLVQNISNFYSGSGLQFYYSIGNEWDLYKESTFPYNKLYSCSQIANFIKTYAVQMKAADPSIKIVAPAVTSFWATDKAGVNIIQDLVNSSSANDVTKKITGTGTLADGKYYIDVVDFHTYAGGAYGSMAYKNTSPPYNNLAVQMSSTDFNTWRTASIAYPGGGFSNELSTNTNRLRKLIDDVNTSRSASPLTFAITEINICYENPWLSNQSSTSQYENTVNGIGCRSFFAGQYWADMMSAILRNGTVVNSAKVEFVTPWSIHESGGDGDYGDLGMTKGTPTSSTPPTPVSTYYHYKMFSDNFKGLYRSGVVSGTAGSANIKAFASQNCEVIAVMVLNQNNDGLSRPIAIRFDNSAFVSPAPDKIRIATVGTNKEFSHTIGSEETIVFFFDGCGNIIKKITYNKSSTAPVSSFLQSGIVKRCVKCTNTYKLNCSNIDTSNTDISHLRGILANSVLIKDSALFEGLVIVPTGITLKIDSAEALFTAGAKIEVEQGGKLIIHDSYLHGCEGTPWEGIYVEGSSDSVKNLIVERSRFEDAIVALSATKSNNITVNDNSFSQGTSAILLNESGAFTITGNDITNYVYGLKTSNTPSGVSLIENNYIGGVTEGISSVNDNHSLLNISCNEFFGYSDYGIHSTGSLMKSQGGLQSGAGNIFTSNSTLVNNQFIHNGNLITYFVDPSNSFSLVTGLGKNVITVGAMNDGCTSYRQSEETSVDALNENLNALMNYTKDQPMIFGNVPNPAADQTSVWFNLGKLAMEGKIVITNLYGNRIRSYKVTREETKVDVDCTDLSDGIYFTTLIVDGKLIGTKKMVIAR